MPRHTILRVLDSNGDPGLAPPDATPKGDGSSRAQAAYIITDILAGNTDHDVNPFWAKWRITDGVTGRTIGRPPTRRAPRATTVTSTPTATSRRPRTRSSRGSWPASGSATRTTRRMTACSRSTRPDRSGRAILSDVSKGMPIEGFSRVRPKGLVTATVDAFTGMRPGPSTRRPSRSCSCRAPQPKKAANFGRPADIDTASGLLWREGCVGPVVTKTFVDYSSAEPGFKAWQKANAAWQQRAAKGPACGAPREAGRRTSTAPPTGSAGIRSAAAGAASSRPPRSARSRRRPPCASRPIRRRPARPSSPPGPGASPKPANP